MNGTATELRAQLAAGATGATEVLARHLDRHDQVDATLNAVVLTDRAGAAESARRADAAPRPGRLPLLGIPMTVKEHIGVTGLPATSGDPGRAHLRPADAPCVARLRDAGAVLIGKTNQSAHGRDWQTYNTVYGVTNNPWDVRRTPGGSSGGGAAAVAAGVVPIDLGTDTAGSLRLPAAFCGVYAHRPTEGALIGAGPAPARRPPVPRMTEVGPIARSAEDLRLVLDVLDVLGPPAPGTHREAGRLSGLRVAMLAPPPWFVLHPDVADAYHRLADVLAGQVHRLAWRTPDLPGGLSAQHDTFLAVLAAQGARLTPREEREEFAAALLGSGDPRDEAWVSGLFPTAHCRALWAEHRRRLVTAWCAFFDDWDLLVAPATPVVAFEHDPGKAADWFSTLDLGDRTGRYNTLFFPGSLAALPGLPATVFPAGRSPAGLPIGLQVLARPGEDRLGIGFAGLLADVIGGFQPPADGFPAPEVPD
ncbi:amidase [Actinoplanes ianthinogenes]|uniref:Amidase n=1 Tax=Actinoplanes ianthinogenes TaxID=122358 RepID=A0ABM7LKA1_9ACTN|nr:amidase family protein [Actinoplanes ianthinogenes]BCJ39697.1 amidase [Actinoplanes ianthinogenes]GGR48053.1 amidase [Actinoplanes ianthinogenes]